jgi:methyltransferase (TIGR00027 family)
MTRSDDDSWDLATSVGATASMVAAARAVATRKPNPLISDPYAEVLVRAAGVDVFARLASGALDYEDIGPGWIPEFFAVRTRFFDDFLPGALSAGIRQVVIVASGLDSRAYRLRWPQDTVLYEIDKPAVIGFKRATLMKAGVRPNVELRTVAADLRQDWPAALQDAGFDQGRPTAWIVEGLMIGYLPGDAQDRLLGQISTLSAAGSRMAADHLPADSPSIGSLLGEVAQTWKDNGFDVGFGNLMYPHDRSEAEDSLRSLGWLVNRHTITDLLAAANVTTHSLDTSPDHHGAIHYLDAIKR